MLLQPRRSNPPCLADSGGARRKHLMFTLATTEGDKVPHHQSRCQQFAFQSGSGRRTCRPICSIGAGRRASPLSHGRSGALIARLATAYAGRLCPLLGQVALGAGGGVDGGEAGAVHTWGWAGQPGRRAPCWMRPPTVRGATPAAALERLGTSCTPEVRRWPRLAGECPPWRGTCLVSKTAPRGARRCDRGLPNGETLKTAGPPVHAPRLVQMLTSACKKKAANWARSANRPQPIWSCVLPPLCDPALDPSPSGPGPPDCPAWKQGVRTPSRQSWPPRTPKGAPLPPSRKGNRPGKSHPGRTALPPDSLRREEDAPPWDVEPEPPPWHRRRARAPEPAPRVPRGRTGPPPRRRSRPRPRGPWRAGRVGPPSGSSLKRSWR